METIYLGFVVFLFLLAIFDLMVGVSNDAVNFLASAVGAKVARFRTIMIIAAIGVFVGAVLSSGMMDIARHGIFKPSYFTFNDLMCVFLAVMVTDVVMLDVFNSLGMPTSTTVSMVFELLGATFVLALLKVVNDDMGMLSFEKLLNTEKALSVILGIFLSIAVAFFFGSLIQWLARVVFTFNYKKRMVWGVGLFGGLACTAIAYFILIKGLKGAPFMSGTTKEFLDTNTEILVVGGFIVFTALMQLLHWFKINVFKIIVLLGTFALAMAFASNDLVNFIGVPLAGHSAYMDYAANGTGDPDGFFMHSLNESAKTPFIFLFIAACIMVFSLITSRKAKNVVKTSVGLSRQEEGDEMFGSSRMARSVVRFATNANDAITKYIPKSAGKWLDKRFDKDEVILENGAAFDIVRAAVNLVVASLLIILGTSLKLPLSTTYVTFIVAMGTSLADRAWSRESAVFRITGVISVIGGWFITAGAAFTVCGLVALCMYYGGVIVMAIFAIVAIGIVIKNNVKYDKKEEIDPLNELFSKMLEQQDKTERWRLLRKHVAMSQQELLDFIWKKYEKLVNSFIEEDLKTMRRALRRVDSQKERFQKIRQKELVGMRSIDRVTSLEKNTWFHLGCNSAEQMLYCMKRLGEPCREHVDNNFNRLPEDLVNELVAVRTSVVNYVLRAERIFEDYECTLIEALLLEIDSYKDQISTIRKKHLDQMHDGDNSLKTSLVYLNILQESQELLSSLRHILRAFNKFQN